MIRRDVDIIIWICYALYLTKIYRSIRISRKHRIIEKAIFKTRNYEKFSCNKVKVSRILIREIIALVGVSSVRKRYAAVRGAGARHQFLIWKLDNCTVTVSEISLNVTLNNNKKIKTFVYEQTVLRVQKVYIQFFIATSMVMFVFEKWDGKYKVCICMTLYTYHYFKKDVRMFTNLSSSSGVDWLILWSRGTFTGWTEWVYL